MKDRAGGEGLRWQLDELPDHPSVLIEREHPGQDGEDVRGLCAARRCGRHGGRRGHAGRRRGGGDRPLTGARESESQEQQRWASEHRQKPIPRGQSRTIDCRPTYRDVRKGVRVTEPRITIIDVARAASVHPSTVSRVLNRRAELSLLPETRQRVIAAARRLGYRPSALARSLRLQRTFTLGMLVPNIDNPFFPPIIKGVEDTAHARGYNLVLCNTEDSSEREDAYLRVLRERQVDGILIASSFMADATIAELRRDRFPFVLVNRGTRGTDDLAVLVDNEKGVAAAIDHLVDLGHRRIGIVAGPQTTMTGRQRLAAARVTLRARGVKLDPSLVSVAEAFSQEAGYRAARRLLGGVEPPTAVFGANDLLPIGVLRAAREAGLECPADLSLVGFNDMPLTEFFGPPLTTVHVPQREMGVRAAELLIGQIEGQPAETRRGTMDVHLVVRGSTAAPSRSEQETA